MSEKTFLRKRFRYLIIDLQVDKYLTRWKKIVILGTDYTITTKYEELK